MKNKKNTNSSKGGIYIAVCCFAVLAAAIGYAGRSNNNSSQPKPEYSSSTDIVSKNTSPSLEIPDQFSKIDTDDVDIIVKDYEAESVLDAPEIPKDNENQDIAVSKKQKFQKKLNLNF